MTSPTELPVSADELREGDRVTITLQRRVTRAHRLRLRALALRESAERDTKRARECRRNRTDYWQRMAAEAAARAARAYAAAEVLDAEADRLTTAEASALPFPLNLLFHAQQGASS